MNPSEQKDFETWLFGKVKGKKTHAWHLLQLLMKKGASNWDDQKVWKTLFKKESFKQERLNKVISNLFKPLMNYLPIIQLRKDNLAMIINTLQALNKQKTSKEFKWFWKKHITSLKKKKGINTKESFFLYEAELEKHKHFLQNPLTIKRTNLPEVSKSFNQYWMLEALQFACYNLSHNKIHGDEIDTQTFEQILPIIDLQSQITKLSLYQVFRKIYDLLKGNSDDENILSAIEIYKDDLDRETLVEAFSLILNYFTRKINGGSRNKIFFNKVIDTYQWGYDNGLLHSETGIIIGHYYNIATICFRLKEYELAKSYTEKWKSEVKEELREMVYNINMAYYYYFQKDYSKARKIILQQPKANLFVTIRLRILNIKMIYEETLALSTSIWAKEENELLKNQIKALQKFIRSQEDLSFIHKDSYLRRLNLFLKLLTAKTKNSLIKLRSEIETDTSLDEYQWLLEKVILRLRNEYQIIEEE